MKIGTVKKINACLIIAIYIAVLRSTEVIRILFDQNVHANRLYDVENFRVFQAVSFADNRRTRLSTNKIRLTSATSLL